MIIKTISKIRFCIECCWNTLSFVWGTSFCLKAQTKNLQIGCYCCGYKISNTKLGNTVSKMCLYLSSNFNLLVLFAITFVVRRQHIVNIILSTTTGIIIYMFSSVWVTKDKNDLTRIKREHLGGSKIVCH